MTHSYIVPASFQGYSRGVKGGIKLDFDMLVAYTKDRFLVPIDHPDALVFAGYSNSKPYPADSNMEQTIAWFIQEYLDNSNGQDGDKRGNANLGQIGFRANDLTQPLDVSFQDCGQIIYASGNRTLHTTPGKGRLPIGRYMMSDFIKDSTTGEVGTELVHYIDATLVPPRFKA